ncbi:hypothetical protein CY34DRAFT_15903 [Suillus luteus UH-Slu-Lm8-n1]|uniref:Uncharacterized protein n=1 Tax=Suillus luteus UH-Slu-Lm8-n1 TaxID=930992 RepID=A0A0C9ZIC4_9AGAM|nr:hypothetical protein CY34DRAFT_15903 [Suillus luteus UH-Slu-Lm8-n1]
MDAATCLVHTRQSASSKASTAPYPSVFDCRLAHRGAKNFAVYMKTHNLGCECTPRRFRLNFVPRRRTHRIARSRLEPATRLRTYLSQPTRKAVLQHPIAVGPCSRVAEALLPKRSFMVAKGMGGLETCGVTCVDDAWDYFAKGLGVEGLVRSSCVIEDPAEVEDLVEDLRSALGWRMRITGVKSGYLENLQSVTYHLLRAGYDPVGASSTACKQHIQQVSSLLPPSPTSPIVVMLDENAGSSTSAKHRERLLSDSSRPTALQESKRYPPRYGAQHCRQDALWEGVNEALPPGWGEGGTGSKEMDNRHTGTTRSSCLQNTGLYQERN